MHHRRRSVLALLALALGSVPSAAQAVAQDAWSSQVTWRTADDWYAVAIHAALMPDGRVLLFGYDRDAEDYLAATQMRASAWVQTPTPLGDALPAELVIASLNEPVDYENAVVPPYLVSDDLFCAGQTHTSDGSLMTVGGTRTLVDLNTGDEFLQGTNYATLFDGQEWTRVPADLQSVGPAGTSARWYPAVTLLPDERILVTSGTELILPVHTQHRSVEIYDPVAGTWEVLSPTSEPPPVIFNLDYTHPWVLPGADQPLRLLMFGESGIPTIYEPDAPSPWSASLQQPRPGTVVGQLPNRGATSALLPLRVRDGASGYANGSALVAGGAHFTSHLQNADVYDPTRDGWERHDMGIGRHHPTAVLLPDARVLVVAGGHKVPTPDLGRAVYIDPANGFTVATGTDLYGEVRGYHSVALLLPDGRVLVGGGRDASSSGDSELSSFRYLYPPYMSRERPELQEAPATIRYGQRFPVVAVGKVASAALISLGAMTHSFDFNQRHVELKVQRFKRLQPGTEHVTMLRAPTDPTSAPPGVYMLFVLDGRRTPSHAAMVRLRR